MIYEALKATLLDVLRAPEGPPEAPIGSPDSVSIFRASRNFLRMRILLHMTSIAPALIGEVLFIAAERFARLHEAATFVSIAVIVVTIVIGVVRYFLIRLDYDMRYYVLTDRSLRIRVGALTIQESTFTFANVQNLTIHQGPLERFFGIATLHIETAGGHVEASQSETSHAAHHQGMVAGIDNAGEVRDRILTFLRAYRDAGLGDHEDRQHALGAKGADWGAGPRIERLREVRDELRALKDALDR